jgi:DNA-directed RNA polymerase subunit RPC12/RpoP
MSTPQSLKIVCPNCSGHVEFPAEMHGQIINCPHCDLSLLLQVPGIPPRVKNKNTSGLGCPNCGSQNIYQRTHSSAAGIGLFIGGIVLAFFTCGIGLVLCVIAVFLNEKRGHCRDCKWTWKT